MLREPRPANGVMQQRNYNAGGVVSKETKADARTATVKLHLGAETPSRLALPRFGSRIAPNQRRRVERLRPGMSG